MASAELLVEVVSDLDPAGVRQRWLRLPAGATVADALRASEFVEWQATEGDHHSTPLLVGCWGRRCELTSALRDRDRVELYRPLAVQPMEARRQRLQRDGLKKQARKGLSGSRSR